MRGESNGDLLARSVAREIPRPAGESAGLRDDGMFVTFHRGAGSVVAGESKSGATVVCTQIKRRASAGEARLNKSNLAAEADN